MRSFTGGRLVAAVLVFGASGAMAQSGSAGWHRRIHGIRHAPWFAATLDESQAAVDNGAALLQTDYERSWRPYPRSPITGLPLTIVYNSPASGPCLVVPGIRLMPLRGGRD